MSTRVGIEKIGAYPGAFSLSMGLLCAARGHDPTDIRETMMIDERSVNPPWEDPVTMAVNAARPILTPDDRARIGLVIVASESGVDQEKPMSTWVQRYLELPSSCRNFEAKHACYGATAALQMACSAVASGLLRGKAALVVSTDQSRMHLGKPWEFVMGAGSCALLVSQRPRLVEIELGKSGVYTEEVSDLTRPTSRVETGNSETSLLSYLEALDGAYTDFVDRAAEGGGAPFDYDGHFTRHVYHAPFAGMTLRAHQALLRRAGPFSKAEARAHWERTCAPALRAVRRMGGTYGASTFLQLTSLLAHDEALSEGDRVSVFSYGSGSCAELYSVRVGYDARAAAREAGLDCLLDARQPLDVATYEAIEQERTSFVDQGDFEPSTAGLGEAWVRQYQGKGRLVFRGAADHYRRYAWS